MSNINTTVPISTNFLDTDFHTGYCESISSIENRRRALLMSIQSLANIRQLAKHISSTVISATSTAIKVNPYIQNLIGGSAEATGHMTVIMETLQAGTQWDIEYASTKVCITLAQALKQLPDEGNQNEIDAAHSIANAYLSLPHAAPTRNNSPEGKYRGYPVGYAELGVPNAPHFLGIDYNGKFIIANTKKALFGVIA
ncbi:hypothetical protein Agabi119p4_10724 [Agaricus bisporus var. burnettii]|uniref:Uncharacterized protein n=1 Tax=Agaricus bisporus var. burnettii TaxID=192524 RepID=A0A8H7C3E9_AGABI|nr:hypothetical protein Agabi119p4_10724 [Agaricus bisporus var. burnettii]